MRKQILYIFALIIFIGCKPNVIVTNYETGEKHEEYEYKADSLKHGYFKSFSKGGVLLDESNFIDGKLDGVRKIYSEAGTLEIEENYNMDVLNGAYTVYHTNGNKKLVGFYKSNVLEGTVKGYYESGEIKEEVFFVNNMENGPFKEYYKNGNLKWEGTYRNGDNEFGLLQEYNEKGELIRKMMCDDRAICTTTWTADGSHENKS